MTALDPGRSFATMVAGGANQLAIAAGRSLAESDRPPFHPLFIRGREGQGKTHLLHAIGCHRLQVAPQATVRLIGWPELAAPPGGEPVAGQWDDLLAADLLLLDDLAPPRSDAARRLLGELIEARAGGQCATVIASSRAPADLLPVDDPLARRLGGGLVVEIGAPDPAMREAVVRRRTGDAGISFHRTVVDEVVGLPLETMRDLVSAVSRLIAFQEVSAIPIGPAQARVLITGQPGRDEPDLPATAGHVVVAPPVVRPRSEPGAGQDPEGDEFGAFLSEIVAGVSQQVDRWRTDVADAILHWQAEGLHTARLQALLDQELPAQPEAVLERYRQDVATLRTLAAEIAELAPDLAGHEALRDPDQLAVVEQLRDEARARGLAGHRPAGHLRLEDLVVSGTLRGVVETLQAATASPQSVPFPLVIAGPSGSGKTHLLHALGHLIDAAGIAGGAVCLGALTLAEDAAAAAARSQAGEWRRRLEWVGGLLVDDIHLLAGRPEVQELLADLMDHLVASGRVVGFTSAEPPALLPQMSARLLSRLGAGTVVELQPPDRELRVAVIQPLLETAGAGSDRELEELLADRQVPTIRAARQLVQRVARAAAERGVAITADLARRVLDGPAADAQPSGSRAPGGTGGGRPGWEQRLRGKLTAEWPDPRDLLIEDLT